MKALITGASSGIGKCMAYELAKRNIDLILVARNKEKLENLKQELNVSVKIITLDLIKEKNVYKLYELTKDDKIDILINNAGFGLMEDFLNFDMATAEKMMRVNVLGLMYATQEVALKMTERQYGAIINVASMAGKMATPKSTVYSGVR